MMEQATVPSKDALRPLIMKRETRRSVRFLLDEAMTGLGRQTNVTALQVRN